MRLGTYAEYGLIYAARFTYERESDTLTVATLGRTLFFRSVGPCRLVCCSLHEPVCLSICLLLGRSVCLEYVHLRPSQHAPIP